MVIAADLLKNLAPNLLTQKKWAVAVSGGPDSLLLTLLLHEICSSHGIEFHALIVDHGLREESESETQSTKALLYDFGIKAKILSIDIEPGSALMSRAREGRLNVLESYCLDKSIPSLFLGQHFDDQAETFLMRLVKKSTLLGLAGMRSQTKKPRVTLVRPMLAYRKSEIIKTLEKKNVTWVEDPSNQNEVFERVRFRNRKAGEAVDKAILNSFETMRDIFEDWVARFLKNHARLYPCGVLSLSFKTYEVLPVFFQEIILQYCLRGLGTGRYPASSQTLKVLVEGIAKDPAKNHCAKGMVITKQDERLWFYRSRENISEHTDVNGLWDERFMCAPGTRTLSTQEWYKIRSSFASLSWLPTLVVPAEYDENGEINLLCDVIICEKTKKKAVFCNKFPFETFFFQPDQGQC